jgi:Protein prenyltransferase alpha subunit repeat
MSRSARNVEYNPILAKKAYNAILNALSKITDFDIEVNVSKWPESVLEIEILPSGIRPPGGQLILQEGRNVGIPKKVLLAAFLYAVQLFAAYGLDRRESTTKDELADVTSIILLHDPEHLTAANYRKKQILALHEADTESGMPTCASAVRRELIFLDSILMSPLHRQTKSPTLWWHRWWLLSLGPVPLDPHAKGVWRELQVVMCAGERHPNNYYAWAHLRRVISGQSCLGNHLQPSHGSELADRIAKAVEEWCLKHPSDTSGWSFLLFIIKTEGRTNKDNDSIVQKAIGFVDDLSWKKEALWVFLRTVVEDRDLMVGDGVRAGVLERMGAFKKLRKSS